MSKYITIDIKGQEYLTAALGLSDTEMNYHCIEKCSVESVNYEANRINIKSLTDEIEYQNIEYICHTDIDYYSYGIADLDLPSAETIFSNSVRGFLYDNGTNYVFGLIRTDPETSVKTCIYSLPCMNEFDRIGPTGSYVQYGNCNIDAIEKTLEVTNGRTYWPHMLVTVVTASEVYAITLLNLDTGEEVKVVNEGQTGFITFPCEVSELSRYNGLVVQTWPDIALDEDWVSDAASICAGGDVEDDLTETVEYTTAGTDPSWWQQYYRTHLNVHTCADTSVTGYWTYYWINTDRTEYTGYYPFYAPQRDINSDLYTFTYYDWPQGLGEPEMFNMPQATTFTNLVTGFDLDEFHVTVTGIIDAVQTIDAYYAGSTYYDTVTEYSADYRLYGSYNDTSITDVATSTTTYHTELVGGTGTDTQLEERSSVYHHGIPNGWQMREPRPIPIIYLFQRWYAYLYTHVFVNQIWSQERSKSETTGTWPAWTISYGAFAANKIVPQLYLAYKNDNDADSTLTEVNDYRITSMNSIIELRTSQFMNDMNYESNTELLADIDFDLSGGNLLYAKYDLLTRKFE